MVSNCSKLCAVPLFSPQKTLCVGPVRIEGLSCLSCGRGGWWNTKTLSWGTEKTTQNAKMDVEEHQLGLSMTSTRCLVNYTKLNRSDFVSHIHIYFTTWTHHIKKRQKRPWPEIPNHGPRFDRWMSRWKVMVVFPLRKVFNCQRVSYYTHRIHGAARKMVTWIPSIYPSHVSIFSTSTSRIRHGIWSSVPFGSFGSPNAAFAATDSPLKAGESHRESNPHFLRTTGDTHLWCTQACAQVTVGV